MGDRVVCRTQVWCEQQIRRSYDRSRGTHPHDPTTAARIRTFWEDRFPTRRDFRHALRGAQDAIDLASILFGVLVIGIIGGVIASTVFVVIPWSQDSAARASLDSVEIAESVARVQDGRYVVGPELIACDLLPITPGITIGTDPDGTCFVAVAESDSDNLLFNTSRAPGSEQLTESTPSSATNWCLDIDSLLNGTQPVQFVFDGLAFDVAVADDSGIHSLLPNNGRLFTFDQPATSPTMVMVRHPSNPAMPVSPEVHLESAAVEDLEFSLSDDADTVLSSCTVSVESTVCQMVYIQFPEGAGDFVLTVASSGASEEFEIEIFGVALDVTVAIVAITSTGWSNIDEAEWTDFTNSAISLPGNAITGIALRVTNNGNTEIEFEVPDANLIHLVAPGHGMFAQLSEIDLVSALQGGYGAGFTATGPLGYPTSGGTGGSLIALP